MVRMKDVLKSFEDLHKGSSEPESPKETQSTTGAGNLSGLEAIRSALQSSLSQQKAQEKKPAPPASSQESTISKIKSALEPREKAAPQFEKKEEQPPSQDDEERAKKLYMIFHRHMEKISTDIKNDTQIDPEPLIKDIPDFCNLIESTEFLFIKAIQRKRFATWFVSHAVNVGVFAVKIGLGLRFDQDKLYNLALAALLHDVGMVKVPTKIIFKHGKLTPGEFDQIRQHPVHGYEIVKHLKKDYPFVVDTVYQEQEREDGSGYPQGLKSADISEFAKVVGIADVFEALVHGRAYREGFITYHAIQKIIENKSKQFNPKIIRGLVNSVSMFPVGSLVRLSSDEVARVITVNRLRPVRPIVDVIENSDGRKLQNPIRINLEEEPLLYITKPIVESG